MGALLEIIAQAVFELAGFLVGRFLLPFVTVGYVRGERLSENHTFRWHGFKRLPDKTVVVQADTVGFIGVLFLLACIVVGVILWKGPGGETPSCARSALSTDMTATLARSATC